jgi:hypothetical protein
MLRFRFSFLAFALAIAGAGAPVRGATPLPREWILPPLDGELSGEFNALLLGGAPKVKWTLTLRTEKPRERSVEFSIEGHGVRLRGDARVDPVGEGVWRLAEAEIDLGVWFGWLAPRIYPDIGDLTISGQVSLSGEGTWRDGVLGGRAKVALRDGRIDNPARKAVFEGVAFSVVLEDLLGRRTAPSQVFTWTSGRYDAVELGAGRIEFTLDGDKVNIALATIAVFGGELAVREVEFSTRRPEFSASAQMTGIDVGELVFLVPKILTHATGRLDGYVDLTRDLKGISVGAGYLGLREGVVATLRFVPRPGILSAALPPAINKLYPGIAEMETAGIPLIADELQLKFVPEGDEERRTAWVHLAGRPADPMFKGPIDLSVNVRGPLDQVFNAGANSALRLIGR